VAVVGIVFITSISRRLEAALNPFFTRVRSYAPAVARVTAGLAFFMSAYHSSLFGPELPLSEIFGSYASAARLLIVLIGLLVLAGLWVRVAAILLALLFSVAVMKHGWYMLTYTNYIGEVIVLLIIGAHRVSLERVHSGFRSLTHLFKGIEKHYSKYALLILRVAFGTSLIYASLYAKFVHNFLALQVASTPLAGHAFEIAHYMGFEPHFMVVGAGIVEVVIGLFFILGLEIRFTALFLEFWLCLSLWYFGEAVWPHLILMGIPIAFFLYGYDQYSLEGRFFKHGQREPVL